MAVGQSKTDPVSGRTGNIYNTLVADADNGLATNATVSGHTLRKLLGALLQAIATEIDGVGTPSGLGNNNPAVQTGYTTDGNITTVATYTPADGEVGTILYHVTAHQTSGAGFPTVTGFFRRIGFRRSGVTTTVAGDGAISAAFGEKGYSVVANASGTDVRIRGTGNAGENVTWTITMAVTKTV